MLSLHKIWTISRYEMKTLLRSWFFRIFSAIAIAFLILISIGLFTNVGFSPWAFKGMTASIPYLSILLLNVVQAIIAVFLASDFLKRDKKLDTTEVVYMRSMTNGDYVLGKTLGILLVFLALNVVILMIAAVFNIFFSDNPFNIVPYLIYPLFISVPTLIYIFGLSFLFMVVIRNQAVTFIVLLGYIAVTIFFLGDKGHHVFDYMAYNVPLMFSDFIGFGNLSMVLIHRGIYFLLGLGFIFATILLIKRLLQSKAMTRFSLYFTILCIGGASFLTYSYLTYFARGTQLRQEMTKLNQQFDVTNKLTPLNYNLNLQHQGKEISVVAKLIFKNTHQVLIKKYIFSLNPGLTIERITSHQQELSFSRDLHLVTVTPTSPLSPDSVDSLTIRYSGTINEQACYLDIDNETREGAYRIWIYNMGKRFAIIEPDYVLLTPEANWYPIAGLPYGAQYPKVCEKDFINFQLNVKTDKNLTALSQGKIVTIADGEFSFLPEYALPQLSLIIGDYEKRSITVDSINYCLYNLKKHDYYSPYFTEIGDTLEALIREQKQDFEAKLGLSYLYPRLSLVEVPIQFYFYPRLWTISSETVQPEMVLIHEKGLLLKGGDFQRLTKWQERRIKNSSQTITPQESQTEIFVQFIKTSLLGNQSTRFFLPEDIITLSPDYTIFPNYYTFVNHFKSTEWPIFNVSLESFLFRRIQPPSSFFSRLFRGISDEEKVNLALMKQSLAEIITDPDKKDIANKVLELKGSYLFKLIQSKITSEVFLEFITDVLKNNHYRDAEVTQFIDELYNKTEFNLKPFFTSWYNSHELPGILFADLKAYKILDDDRTRFQVRFKVQNPEPVEGLVSVLFRMGGRGRGSFGARSEINAPDEQYISLAPGQTKEVGIILDDAPRVLILNTLISQNLPATLHRRFDKLEMDKKAKPFEGERILDEGIKLFEPGEIVVDNEDSGFEVLYQPNATFLKKLFQKEKDDEPEYIGLNVWRAPSRWRLTTYSDFYGKYIHSAYYIKRGDGDKKVAWTTKITESGNYDIYYHAATTRLPWMRRRSRRKFVIVEQFHFLVHHDDGTDKVTFNAEDAEDGWNFLGTYYLSPGIAKIELSDETKGRMVYADAVKWVKH